MVPYVVFSLLGHLLKCVKMFMEGDYYWVHYILSPIKQIMLSGSLGGNLPLWFLPSLLAVQVLYAWLHKRMRKKWIILLSLVIAYSLYILNIDKPLYLGNVSLGLTVYAFGHVMKEHQYKCPMFILSGILYVALLLLSVGSMDFRANGIGQECYLCSILFSLCGCIFINNLFRKYSLNIAWLQYVGKRSMAFYVLHWLILMSCQIVMQSLGFSDNVTFFWLAIISCCIFLPLASETLIKSKYRFVLGLR